MGCTSAGAARAAENIYRRLATVDPVDLTTPLAKDLTLAGAGTASQTNRGLQPNDGGTIVISVAFDGAGDTADLSIVNWGRNKAGDLVPLSVRDLTQIAAGVFTDADGKFMGSELVEPGNATLFEIRVRALTGAIDKLHAWAY